MYSSSSRNTRGPIIHLFIDDIGYWMHTLRCSPSKSLLHRWYPVHSESIWFVNLGKCHAEIQPRNLIPMKLIFAIKGAPGSTGDLKTNFVIRSRDSEDLRIHELLKDSCQMYVHISISISIYIFYLQIYLQSCTNAFVSHQLRTEVTSAPNRPLRRTPLLGPKWVYEVDKAMADSRREWSNLPHVSKRRLTTKPQPQLIKTHPVNPMITRKARCHISTQTSRRVQT